MTINEVKGGTERLPTELLHARDRESREDARAPRGKRDTDRIILSWEDETEE